MKTLSIAVGLLLFAWVANAGQTGSASRSAQTLRDATTDNNASCDISTSPAATLLLPYFEVDVNSHVTKAQNTIFSIINTSRSPQIARVTVWTDSGYPALWFNVFLTGYDVQSISLYDVLARGIVPATSNASPNGLRSAPNSENAHFVALEGCAASGGELTAEVLANVQSVLTVGAAASSGACKVGTSHTNAAGYVTVDLVNSCSPVSPLDVGYYSQILAFENVLTGDYERINPDTLSGNFAGGSPLVHIKAIPEGGGPSTTTPLPYTFYDRYTPPNTRKVDRRQPLPSSFAARFIQGGKAQFFTDFVMWREGQAAGTASCTSANATMALEPAVRFDEDENPTVNVASPSSTAPSAAAISTASNLFPPLTGFGVTGWMLVNLDNKAGMRMNNNPYSTQRSSQNWLIVRLSADGRYAVDYEATALKNGCVSSGPVTSIVKQRGTQ
jgi:hypothetical protein